MQKLRVLDARGHQITNLTGLEQATQLKALALTGNQVSNLSPLSRLVQLEALFLNTNQIRDVSPLARLLSNKDGENAIPQVESAEISVGEVCRCQYHHLCGERRDGSTVSIGTSSCGYVSESESCGVLGW